MNFIFRVISTTLGKTIIGQLLHFVIQAGTFQIPEDSLSYQGLTNKSRSIFLPRNMLTSCGSIH